MPHLSYAVLRRWDLDEVERALAGLPAGGPVELRFDALGMFRRSRSWLVPAIEADVSARQQHVVEALLPTGADLHHHYRPGAWVPHCTLAPRVRLDQTPALAAAVYDVLPLVARSEQAALVDSGTGEVHPLPRLP